jgi:hypothetical protein
MITYPFPRVIERNLDMFPINYGDGLYCFHGTCDIYSDVIERSGFSRSWLPFKLSDALKLIKDVNAFTIDQNIQGKVNRLIEYITLRRQNNASFSLTISGYESAYYSTEFRRGGQIFIGIEKLLLYLKKELGDKYKFKSSKKFAKKYKGFFVHINRIKKSKGCLYLINLDVNDLQNLSEEGALNDLGHFICYKKIDSIAADKIIGRILIPRKYIVDSTRYQLAVEQSNQRRNEVGLFRALIQAKNPYGDIQR